MYLGICICGADRIHVSIWNCRAVLKLVVLYAVPPHDNVQTWGSILDPHLKVPRTCR